MNRRRRKIVLLPAAIALMAASCAAPPRETDTWRNGRISDVLPGSKLDDVEDRPCVAHIPNRELADRYFAIVTWPRGRALGYRTLPVPDVSEFQVGDRVWFHPYGCDPPSKDPPPR